MRAPSRISPSNAADEYGAAALGRLRLVAALNCLTWPFSCWTCLSGTASAPRRRSARARRHRNSPRALAVTVAVILISVVLVHASRAPDLGGKVLEGHVGDAMALS